MRVIAVLCHSPTALTGTVYRLLKETRMTLAKTDLHAWLAIFFGVSTITASVRAESPIQSAPAIETTLRISISRFEKRTSLVRQEGGCSAARSAVLRRRVAFVYCD